MIQWLISLALLPLMLLLYGSGFLPYLRYRKTDIKKRQLRVVFYAQLILFALWSAVMIREYLRSNPDLIYGLSVYFLVNGYPLRYRL